MGNMEAAASDPGRTPPQGSQATPSPGPWGGSAGGAGGAMGPGQHPLPHQRVLSVQLPPGGAASLRSPGPGAWGVGGDKRGGAEGSPVRPGSGAWEGGTNSPRFGHAAHVQQVPTYLCLTRIAWSYPGAVSLPPHPSAASLGLIGTVCSQVAVLGVR